VFRTAFRLSPWRPVLGLHLATSLYREGKSKEALKVLRDIDKTASEPFRQEIGALRRRIESHR
jgi:hypothetical protein